MSSIHTFVTVADVKEYAPGVDQSLLEATIRPYLYPAHKIVASIVGIDLFNQIADGDNAVVKSHLKSAVANRVMYDYKLFETVQKRQTGNVDTYKYELQAMQDSYLAYYFDAVDSLIRELQDNSDQYSAWKDTTLAKAIDTLMLKTTDEFNSCYLIDSSDYFFFSTVSLQQRVIDQYVTGIDVDALSEPLHRRLKRVVATFTVAYALRQFDFTMLPRSLRNAAAEGASRNAKSEQELMYNLSEYLFGQADDELSQILFELNKPDDGEDIPSPTNQNKPWNKFFLMS